jgi:protein subunit release factor A
MGRFNGLSTEWLEDVEWHTWPPRRQGGQHVGVQTGVIACHRPTGIAVAKDSERSQWKNREAAMDHLRSILDRLYPEAT